MPERWLVVTVVSLLDFFGLPQVFHDHDESDVQRKDEGDNESDAERRLKRALSQLLIELLSRKL